MITGIEQITRLTGKEDYKTKLNDCLTELGFKKVFYNKKFKSILDYYNKLTISIRPSIGEDCYSTEILKDIQNLEGYRTSYSNSPIFYNRNITSDFLWTNSIDNTEYFIARYYKERNLLMFFYPMFDNLKYDIEASKNKAFDFVLDVIKKICKEREVVEIVQTMTKEKLVVEAFLEQFRKEVEHNENNQNQNLVEIVSYREALVRKEKDLMMLINRKKAAEEFIIKGEENLNTQINDIKTLPFVKQVVLEEGMIKVYVGEIEIVLDATKKASLGEMFFMIMPNKIEVDAVKRKKVWIDNGWRELIHPHIRTNNVAEVCLGERNKDIYNLLANFELRKLVFALYLWAKSYNPNDKYHAIGYWTGDLGLSPEEIKARREKEETERASVAFGSINTLPTVQGLQVVSSELNVVTPVLPVYRRPFLTNYEINDIRNMHTAYIDDEDDEDDNDDNEEDEDDFI